MRREHDEARLNATFAALADPTRRGILRELAAGERSVTQLVAPFRMSQPAITKHLQVLERAGLVERRRDARFVRCRMRAETLADAWTWLGGYQRFWESALDRLDGYATQLHAKRTQGTK